MPDWWKERLRGADIVINDECWQAFEIFSFCSTQWRTSATGGRTGLDYTAVYTIAKVWGCADKQTMDYIRYLEAGAIMQYLGKNPESLLDG